MLTWHQNGLLSAPEFLLLSLLRCCATQWELLQLRFLRGPATPEWKEISEISGTITVSISSVHCQ
jgi:hypothetical protein